MQWWAYGPLPSLVYELGRPRIAVPRLPGLDGPFQTIPPSSGCQAGMLMVHDQMCWQKCQLIDTQDGIGSAQAKPPRPGYASTWPSSQPLGATFRPSPGHAAMLRS